MASFHPESVVDAAVPGKPPLNRLDLGLFLAFPLAYFGVEPWIFPPVQPTTQLCSWLLLFGGMFCTLRHSRGLPSGRRYGVVGFAGACGLRLLPLLPSVLGQLRTLV